MVEALAVYAFIFIVILVSSFYTEVAYRKRKPADVLYDCKRLFVRTLVYFGMAVAATSILYLQYTVLFPDR
jgi:hypothetical protein